MGLLRTIAAGIGCVTLCIACSDSGAAASSSSTGFPSAALVSATSDSGTLSIEVRTGPSQPPARGTCEVEYRITDAASGQPVDGLSVDVVPWMVSMGHGSSGKPTVAAKGDGRYVASKVSLYMAGRWELRTTLSGARADQAAPAIDVE